MPDLQELEAGRARLVVPFRDLEVAVEYFPDRVSGRTMAAIQRAQAENAPMLLFSEAEHLLASWDLTRGGEPIPLDRDGIASVNALLTLAVLAEILQDFANPKSRVMTGDEVSKPSSLRSLPTSAAAGSSGTARTTRA